MNEVWNRVSVKGEKECWPWLGALNNIAEILAKAALGRVENILRKVKEPTYEMIKEFFHGNTELC